MSQPVGVHASAAPEISVGLPVYNGERFLPQALDTLLAQTLQDFELIISDNGSTDRTEELCRDYAARDGRIRYLRYDVNRGATWNWNKVVHEARGAFFKWASANDYCDPRMLERCVAVLRDDPAAVLCYPLTWLVDDDGRRLEQYARDIEVREERPSARFMRVRGYMFMNNAQAGLIRLSALRRTQLERSYAYGDMVLMAELALYGTFHLLREPLFFRRVGGASMSRDLSPEELQRFLDPARPAPAGGLMLRTQLDCMRSVLRAPIGLIERLRGARYVAGCAFAERQVIWRELADRRGAHAPHPSP